MFKSSQFLDIVNKIDAELVDDECAERNTIFTDISCNHDSAEHNAKIVRSSPGNTNSSSDDLEHNGYRTKASVYDQYEEGSSSG